LETPLFGKEGAIVSPFSFAKRRVGVELEKKSQFLFEKTFSI
jgi:hypothetical protein